MTLKQLLLSMLVATIICWFIWAMILTQVDPTDSGSIGFALFYISLFFSLLGSFFLVSFGWRKVFTKFAMDYKLVGTSFRQSVFFAILVIGILSLQSQGLLTWWNIILIIFALTIVEGFFLSMKKQS